MTRCACVLVCLLLLCPGTAWAAYPGFRTIGIWNGEDRVRLDLCVWYPVQQPPSAVRHGGWLLRINHRAAPLDGLFPLVVISHDSPGSRFTHHDLAASLAAQGFIVVAPTHQEDNVRNMRHLYTARQLTRRLDEIRQTIDVIRVNPEIGPLIDANRIGLLGFGAGATTALLAIGGRISPKAWAQWKADAPADAPYLHPWARNRLDELVAEPSLHRLQANDRIRCAIAAAPAYSMAFDLSSLARVRVPVMLLAADQDPNNPRPGRLEALRDKLPTLPDMALIRGADPISLMAQPENRQTDALPGYAAPSMKQRQQIFDQLNAAVSEFFLRILGNPNLPPPPPPLPDDTKQNIEEANKPVPAKNAKQQKKPPP